MVRSREEVDSRQLTVHRQKRDKDLTQRTQSAQRARRSEKREFDGPDRAGIIDRRRKKIGARFSGCCPESAISCPYRGTGERKQTKKKGESRQPQLALQI